MSRTWSSEKQPVLSLGSVQATHYQEPEDISITELPWLAAFFLSKDLWLSHKPFIHIHIEKQQNRKELTKHLLNTCTLHNSSRLHTTTSLPTYHLPSYHHTISVPNFPPQTHESSHLAPTQQIFKRACGVCHSLPFLYKIPLRPWFIPESLEHSLGVSRTHVIVSCISSLITRLQLSSVRIYPQQVNHESPSLTHLQHKYPTVSDLQYFSLFVDDSSRSLPDTCQTTLQLPVNENTVCHRLSSMNSNDHNLTFLSVLLVLSSSSRHLITSSSRMTDQSRQIFMVSYRKTSFLATGPITVIMPCNWHPFRPRIKSDGRKKENTQNEIQIPSTTQHQLHAYASKLPSPIRQYQPHKERRKTKHNNRKRFLLS